MDKKVLKHLSDVLTAIEEIDMFMSTRPKQYQVFCDDLLFRRGIERNLEIIGEAMNRAYRCTKDCRHKKSGNPCL